MTTVVTLSEFMPYGAPELQSAARQYMLRALLLSNILCTLLFAAAGLLGTFAGSVPPATRPIEIRLHALPMPPSLERFVPVQPVAPAPAARVTAGLAVPVPDDQAPSEATIASRDELRTATPDIGTGNAPLVVAVPAPPETLPDWGAYVYVEELPEPIRRVSPQYPVIANEAGVSGKVVTHALVGKDGRVLDVRVDPQHSIPMLNDAAVQAVRQWAFKPAFANGRPVAVWVLVPFNFTLR